MKTKKKALLVSIMTIALCVSLIAGSTYALFTSSKELDVAVTAGQVELTAVYDTSSMLTWSSLYHTEADARTDGKFDNNGTAKFEGTNVIIDRMTPGDVAKFKIDVENLSNVNVQYRVRMISLAGAHEVDLTEALTITAYIDGAIYPVTGTENASVWRFIDANQPIEDIWVTVAFRNTPMDLSDLSVGNPDNKYQNAQAKMAFVVEAVQGNAQVFNYVAAAEGQTALMNPANPGYVANTIHNGEGATIAVDEMAVAGDVTFSNITLNGANTDESTVLWAVGDSTVILADGANVIAPTEPYVSDGYVYNTYAYAAMLGADEVATLIVDENSSITAAGSEAVAVFVQGGTFNLVLNGSGLINVDNGGIGLGFSHSTVHIFVKDAAALAEYRAMVETINATVYWYVDGTAV